MALHIVTADERLATSKLKITMAFFVPSGVGKTSLLMTLHPETLCVDFEAGRFAPSSHCQNSWSYPGKDRAGRFNEIEQPRLGQLIGPGQR